MHRVPSKVGKINLMQIHAVKWYRSQLHKAIWFVCGPCQRSINILSPLSPFSAGSDVQDGVCQRLAAADMPPRKLGVWNSEPCVVWSTYLQFSAQRKRERTRCLKTKKRNVIICSPSCHFELEHMRRNVLVTVFPLCYNEWGLKRALNKTQNVIFEKVIRCYCNLFHFIT